MEDDNLKGIVTENLNKYGLGEFMLMKQGVRSQYTQLEEYFQKCILKCDGIKKEIFSIDLSVKGVCEAVGIGRSTLYVNSDTLKVYVENRIKEIENIDLLNEKKVVYLEEKYAIAENLFKSTKINIIRLMNVEQENETLKKKNAELEKTNVEHFEERQELTNRIDLLERKFLEVLQGKRDVISMGSKKHYKDR